MKRYLYLIIGIVVAAILAILVLLFIRSRSTVPSLTTTSTGSLPSVGLNGSMGNSTQGISSQNSPSVVLSLGSSSTSGAGSQGSANSFGILATVPILDYFVNARNVITAVQPNGPVITITNGQSTVISTSTMNGIISANFSYDGQKILVNFGDPNNPQSSLFDLKTKSWTNLPVGLLSPQWSSSDYQIAYLSAATSGKISLSIVNAANLKSGVATLLTLHANDLSLQWPNKTEFILSDKPTSYIETSIWLFNSQANKLTSLAYNTNGSEILVSKGASPMDLFFSNGPSGNNPMLQLNSLNGNSSESLTLQTLPSKCLFNNETTSTSTSSAYIALYCGIPRDAGAFSSARLPDDYNMMALFTSDDIYKVNTQTGQTQVLWSGQSQNIDATDLKVFNKTLFFTNRYNQELYGLVLSQ